MVNNLITECKYQIENETDTTVDIEWRIIFSIDEKISVAGGRSIINKDLIEQELTEAYMLDLIQEEFSFDWSNFVQLHVDYIQSEDYVAVDITDPNDIKNVL